MSAADIPYPPETTAADPFYYPGEPTTPVVPQPFYVQPQPPRMGWVCPKCNQGIAPDVLVCPCTPIPINLIGNTC
jgi:hypothetical protein